MPIFDDPNDPRSKLPYSAQQELFRRGQRPGVAQPPKDPRGNINSGSPTGFSPWSKMPAEVGDPALDQNAVKQFRKSLIGE